MTLSFEDAMSVSGSETFISLTTYPGACLLITDGQVAKSSVRLALVVRQAEGPQSSPAAAGVTYTIPSETSLPAASASAYLSSYDATCTEAPLSFASGGTVTITSVSGDHVAGTFDLRFDDDHISGTFDAPTCPGLAKIPTLKTITCP